MLTYASMGGLEIPVFSVSREGFPTPPNCEVRISSEKDIEFLDKFMRTLVKESLDPDDLVFSGFDGTDIKRKREISSAPNGHVWVTNETAWRNALTHTTTATPEVYAERRSTTPCVGIYTKDKLQTATLGDDVIGLNPQGKALTEIPTDTEIYDPVTHIDSPRAEVNQALQGLAFFDY